jgi:hypothetical protein
LMIFKRGDDLRQDFVVQTIFFVLNRLWQQSPMVDKPFIYQYKYVILPCETIILFYLLLYFLYVIFISDSIVFVFTSLFIFLIWYWI